MSRELKLEDIKFDDILEELKVIIFGYWYEDDEGNWYENDYCEYLDDKRVELVDKVFGSHEPEDYLFMQYIFKYKDKYFSIIKNEDSYGDSGWDTGSLKEVFPKEVTKTIYE